MPAAINNRQLLTTLSMAKFKKMKDKNNQNIGALEISAKVKEISARILQLTKEGNFSKEFFDLNNEVIRLNDLLRQNVTLARDCSKPTKRPERADYPNERAYLMALDNWLTEIMAHNDDTMRQFDKPMKVKKPSQKKKQWIGPSLELCAHCPYYWKCKIRDQGFALCPQILRLNNRDNGRYHWYKLECGQKEKIKLN